jgi:hypothetical protein
MTLMARQAKYHALGFAIRRVMNAPNVEVTNLKDLAARIDGWGYPADEKLMSSYMRLWPEDHKDPKKRGEPRSRPTIDFVFAFADAWELHDEQREDLLLSWIAIQPEARQDGYRRMCQTLSGAGYSSEAWREMVDFEAGDSVQGEGEGGADGQSARNRGETT